jgi:SAM-dependent methyltransferase
LNTKPTCRHCRAKLHQVFADLGTTPPSNAYLSADALKKHEQCYPLIVYVCNACWLVQTQDFARPEQLFESDYAYFSSYSLSWLQHSANYATAMTKRFNLSADSLVVEVASNDGYLLQNFRELGVPCLGIEPTHAAAEAARLKGIETLEEFFGVATARTLASQGQLADLMTANNVLAHVPDINDFTEGFHELLKPAGVVTFEFPHLLKLVGLTQFDTIYHEHFSYLSLFTAENILHSSGLSVFDVEELPTHGGSLRVFARRSDGVARDRSPAVDALLKVEIDAGISNSGFYGEFQSRCKTVRDNFRAFLRTAKADGKTVAGYGAAAKGNTLLNYARVGPDTVAFVADRNPHKSGKFLPGSRIPIVAEDVLRREKPDFVVVFPWNLIQELEVQLAYVSEWNGQLVTVVPELNIRKR